MWLLIIQAIWLGLPAAASNIAPAVGTRFFPKFLNIPIDFHKMYRTKRILGDNKTVRGFLFGILLGEIIFLLQQSIFHVPLIHSLSILPYVQLPWYFGFLFGIGALGGDTIESIFKRQLGIAPGKTWFPFDQVDWAVGTLLLLLLFVPIPISVILVGLSLGIVLHIVVKFVGYSVGIDSKPI